MRRLPIACLLFALSPLACRRESDSAVAGDAGDVRVVSLAPSMTESLFAIGAGGLVVGRTRFCDAPEEATKVRVVGGFADPDVEAILLLRPTLIVGAPSPAIESLRRAAPFAAFLTPKTDSIADIERALRALGDKTAHEADAERVVTRIESELRDVDARYASAQKRKVLFVFGVSPLVVAGRIGYAGEMLRHIAAENVIEDDVAYPTIDGERAERLRPEIVLFALGMGHTEVPERIRLLAARSKARIENVEDGRILRPGPRVAEGAALLGRKVHPEVPAP